MSSQLENNTTKLNNLNQQIDDFLINQSYVSSQKPLGSLFLQQTKQYLSNVVDFNNIFVGFLENLLSYSQDGKTWITASKELTGIGESFIVYNDTVILASNYSDKKVLVSTDGINWQTILTDIQVNNLCYVNNLFFVLSNTGIFYYSDDGYLWNEITTAMNNNCWYISYNDNLQQYLITDNSFEETILCSNSLDEYTYYEPLLSSGITDLLVFKDKWLAFCDYAIYYSLDGINWSTCDVYWENYSNAYSILQTKDIIAINEQDICYSYYYSLDGITWSSIDIGPFYNYYYTNSQAFAYNGEKFFGIYNNTVYESSDLLTWSLTEGVPVGSIERYAYVDGIYLLSQSQYNESTDTTEYIYSFSQDGQIWIKSNIVNEYSNNITVLYKNNTIVLSDENAGTYVSYQLEN